jgi:hypothetical protein
LIFQVDRGKGDTSSQLLLFSGSQTPFYSSQKLEQVRHWESTFKSICHYLHLLAYLLYVILFSLLSHIISSFCCSIFFILVAISLLRCGVSSFSSLYFCTQATQHTQHAISIRNQRPHAIHADVSVQEAPMMNFPIFVILLGLLHNVHFPPHIHHSHPSHTFLPSFSALFSLVVFQSRATTIYANAFGGPGVVTFTIDPLTGNWDNHSIRKI